MSWDDDACVPKPDPATPSLFNTRVTVLSSETFHAPKRASDDGRDIGAQPRSAGIDTTINDPAVAGTLLTLTPVGSVSSQAPYPTAFAPVPPPKGIPKTTGQPYNDLKGLQGGVCTLKVVLVDALTPAGISPPDAAGSMTVSVPTGEVWKLSIAPAITHDAKDRFESFLTTGKGQLAGAESDGYIASADAFDLLIEAAAPINLDSQSLWSALSTEQKAGKLDLCLNPNASNKAKSWHLIRRVEVTRQAWRWSGRSFSADIPTAGPEVINRLIPGTTEPGPQMTTALNWEAEAFADRETDGLLSQAIAYFGPQQLSAGWSSSQLLSLDLSGDRRAQYFRFTARAFSRYEGLPGFTAFTQTSSDSLAANQPLTISRTADGATPWVRHLWPATIAPGDIPAKPKLLLAIPLTRSGQVKDSADRTKLKLPGLLVILDEPWFQVAGLAECLRMSIDIAHGKEKQRLQLGPDPIFTPIPDTPLPTPGVTHLTGDPMGLTFDESNTASLFRNTCFYFDLDPLAKAAALDTLDWYMAKVNFTRTIQGSQLNPPSNTDIESQPTESTWVQFLPNGSTITTQDNKLVRCDAIGFAAQNDGSLQFTPAIKPGPRSAQPTAHLEFWALVMHDVTDASGSTSEGYVGLFRPDKHGALRPFNGVAIELSEAGGTHLYLLEVQVSPRFQADPAPSWITQLFPTADGEQTQDATHRILRISDRINHNPSKNHTTGAGK